MKHLNVVFMGTPDFALPTLEALLQGPDRVLAVVTQPDRPVGRGQKVQHSPVKRRAVQADIEVIQPTRLRGEQGTAFRQRIHSLAPDLIVVVAFGQILPEDLLNLPRLGCINVHASLLPRWRGASPIQWAIAAGDEESGVSIMQMDAGLDTGPVLLERRVPIEHEETGGGLHDRLADLGASALIEALERIRKGGATFVPQVDEASTYAPMLSKEDARLDFSRPAVELERRVRAFQPWPGAYTSFGGQTLKVLQSTVSSECGVDQDAGTVVGAGREGIDVACGGGCLRLLEVQPQGKRPMSASAFLAGRRGGLVGHRAG